MCFLYLISSGSSLDGANEKRLDVSTFPVELTVGFIHWQNVLMKCHLGQPARGLMGWNFCTLFNFLWRTNNSNPFMQWKVNKEIEARQLSLNTTQRNSRWESHFDDSFTITVFCLATSGCTKRTKSMAIRMLIKFIVLVLPIGIIFMSFGQK